MKELLPNNMKLLTGMIVLALFCGLGAVFGSFMGMLSPDGSFFGGEAMIPCLTVLPFADTLFQNLFLPALGLFLLVAVPNLVAGILLLRHRRAGAYVGCAEGVVMSLFTLAEIVVLGVNPLSIIFCCLGATMCAGCAFLLRT